MVTIGAAMQRRGHKVWIVSGSGPGINLSHKLGIETRVLPSKCHSSIEFNWQDYIYLRNLIRELKPDIINSFANGIPALILSCHKTRTSVTATLCGGPPRRIIPYLTPIIVFSEELKQNMVALGIPEKDVHIIPGRICFEKPSIDSDVHEFFSKMGVNAEQGPFIFMICRADLPKQRALQNFFSSAELYAQSGGKGTFIHIGKGKDSKFVSDLYGLVDGINRRSGRKVLVSTDEGSDAPVKLLYLADIVVGMGRSAFEGMMLAKPTIVLSNEGCGGIVNEQNVPLLALYNFTSRGAPQMVDMEVQQSLVTNIFELSQSLDKSEGAASFGFQWCRNNLDVDQAAGSYESIFYSMMLNSKPRIRWANLGMNICYETMRTIMYKLLQKLYSFRM